MERKNFLKWVGALFAAFLAGIFWRKSDSTELCSPSIPKSNYSNDQSAFTSGGVRAHNSYGSPVEPPLSIGEEYTKRFSISNLEYANNKTVDIDLNIIPLKLQIAHNITYDAWTFNGMVPGPIFRAKLGQELHFHLLNSSTEIHSLHFHGAHSPQEDGWQGVPAFGKKDYKIKLSTFGILPYHCHVPPISLHISKGLYGALIVDPPTPRVKAHEFVLIFSNWFLDDGKKVYTWNGVTNLYDRFPMKVPVGEKVRFYIVNLLEGESTFTFHIHATTFEIIRSLNSTRPEYVSDVVTLGPTDRVILEFTLPERGRYMFHPHETHMAENGGMGWIVAV